MFFAGGGVVEMEGGQAMFKFSRPTPPIQFCFFYVQQIEFYFSDSNLLKDRFMKQAILNDPDGCKYNPREVMVPNSPGGGGGTPIWKGRGCSPYRLGVRVLVPFGVLNLRE